MSINDGAVGLSDNRDTESELPDGCTHTINLRIIFARVPCVRYQSLNRPLLDIQHFYSSEKVTA